MFLHNVLLNNLLSDTETKWLGTKLPKRCERHTEVGAADGQEDQPAQQRHLVPLALGPIPRFLGDLCFMTFATYVLEKQKKVLINLENNRIGLHFGRFFKSITWYREYNF
jgi:hypothetical protein